MPRGKYERKSAQGVKAPRATAKTKSAMAAEVPLAEVAPDPKAMASPDFLVKPEFYKNKRVAVDRLAGQPLHAYARYLGVSQRDVDELTEDRLRQNCKARINMITEDD